MANKEIYDRIKQLNQEKYQLLKQLQLQKHIDEQNTTKTPRGNTKSQLGLTQRSLVQNAVASLNQPKKTTMKKTKSRNDIVGKAFSLYD